MKTVKKKLMILTLPLLISFAKAQNGGITSHQNDTIKKTIYDYKGQDGGKKFIDALKLGDPKLIQNMSTKAGYKSLLKTFPTHHQLEKCLKQLYSELSVAEFSPGVSEEMVDYFYFNFDNQRRYTVGILSPILKEGGKLVIFKSERNLSNKTTEVIWGQ